MIPYMLSSVTATIDRRQPGDKQTKSTLFDTRLID